MKNTNTLKDLTLTEILEKYIIKNNNITSNYKKEVWWKNRDIIHHYEFLKSISLNISEAIYIYLYNRPVCKECGKNTKFLTFGRGYNDFCSTKCSNIYNLETRKETSIKKYGVDNPSKSQIVKNKIKDTMFKRYGSFYTQTVDYTDNVTKTNLAKYGKKWYMSTNDFKEKSKDSMLSKYGVEHNFNNGVIRENSKQTMLSKYGVNHALQNETIKQNFKTTRHNTTLKDVDEQGMLLLNNPVELKKLHHEDNLPLYEIANIIGGISYQIVSDYFNKYDIDIRINSLVSYKETEIVKFLGSNIVSTSNRKILGNNKEIDIVTSKILIEYNGIYWHSNIDKNYHLIKTNKAEEKGYKLFHIFENEWIDNNKQLIWKSMLNSAHTKTTRIYARKTIVKEVSSKEAKEFLNKTHLQGYINSKVRIGLYHEDVLVSIMTFGKPRYNKDVEWELLRFSSKLNTTIVGGASKMLKYFEKTYKPSSLLSYANRRWSQGNVYEKLGFDFIEDTKPNLFYVDSKGNIHSRIKFQKHKLKDMLDNYDDSVTGIENMLNNGYRTLYDCGNKKYIKQF